MSNPLSVYRNKKSTELCGITSNCHLLLLSCFGQFAKVKNVKKKNIYYYGITPVFISMGVLYGARLNFKSIVNGVNSGIKLLNTKTIFLQLTLQSVGETKERINYIEKYSERIFSVESFLLNQDLSQYFMFMLVRKHPKHIFRSRPELSLN